MVIKKSKTSIVMDCIISDDEMSIEDIAKKAGCSKAHVSTVRRRYAEKLAESKKTENPKNEEEEEEEVNEEIDSFIKKIKVTPDPKHLTKDQDESDEEIEYGCPECGHQWYAAPDERQNECPKCGEEFE